THTVLIDWGDGHTGTLNLAAGQLAFSQGHQYLDNGSYAVQVTVTDKDGGSNAYSTSVTVNNVAPTASITGAPAGSPEGAEISLRSTVTDPGTADPFTYAWSVTRNGVAYTTGTPTNGSTFTFTPDDDGAYVVTLTVTDDDGGVGSGSASTTVTNVAP